MRLIDVDALMPKLKFIREAEHQIYGKESWEFAGKCITAVEDAPTIEPEPCGDADKLKRCRFEYINTCKIVTYPTPDTNKNDIYDAHAVIKALHPIFGDEEF